MDRATLIRKRMRIIGRGKKKENGYIFQYHMLKDDSDKAGVYLYTRQLGYEQACKEVDALRLANCHVLQIDKRAYKTLVTDRIAAA